MQPLDDKKRQRIYNIKVSDVYPHYLTKAEKKGRSGDEVAEIVRWLTGYSQAQLEDHLANEATFEEFFRSAPALNPNRTLITGVICGVRVEEIDDPIYQDMRYLDKLIDELARGKKMEKILREP